MSMKNRNKLVPMLRFPEFENDGEWSEKNLGEVTYVVSERNKNGAKFPIYSISNTAGFVPQSEQFEGVDSHKRGYDISLYKIIGENTFAYNPARINIGSIGYSGKLHNILISSLYVCFKTVNELDDSFLLYFWETLGFNKSVLQSVEGGIRSYLFYENFAKIKVQISSVGEQQKIASCLSSLDEVITGESQKLEALKEHKKGLLQNLFPQEGDTVPKLRFKEFENSEEWKVKKLGEVGEPLMCKRIFKEETTPNPNNGVPFYKIGTFGRVADSYISKEIYEEFKSKYSFPKIGDVLISASGTIGRLVIYDGSPAYFQDSNIIWLGHDEGIVKNRFLFYCYTNLRWQTSDGGVIIRLYNSDFKRMTIQFPISKTEQQKIASCLSSLDDLITAQAEKIELLKQHKQGLLQGLFPSHEVAAYPNDVAEPIVKNTPNHKALKGRNN